MTSRTEAEPTSMWVEPEGFRARLRFRLSKRLHSEGTSMLLMLCGREVKIRPPENNTQFCKSDWLVITAKGFETESEARAFGEQMRRAVEAAGMILMSGVDVGQSRITSWVSEEYARSIGVLEPHQIAAPNVHGLSILPDSDDVRILQFNATGEVSQNADMFFDVLRDAEKYTPSDPEGAAAGFKAINAALMSGHPLAQVALAISAVEALGQQERWSKEQRQVLNQLATQVENSSGLSENEAGEIAKAIRRMHKIGLREGVLRVFSRLNLMDLKTEWDRIYSARSGLFHGTNPLSEGELTQLALDAVKLCGRVMMAIAKTEGVEPPPIYYARYEVPSSG